MAAPKELMVQQSSTCAHSVEPRMARLKSQRLRTSETISSIIAAVQSMQIQTKT